jgi:hypothetical protein
MSPAAADDEHVLRHGRDQQAVRSVFPDDFRVHLDVGIALAPASESFRQPCLDMRRREKLRAADRECDSRGAFVA